MSSKIVKCHNCNIVINEVLAFVQNKVDVMNEDSLAQVCTTAFSSEEIENAKCLLFESVTTSIRKIPRRNDKKSHKNVDDIISLIKQTDPEVMPIFVAKDLQKLPPITFDHVDVTRLLKDILILKNDITAMKSNFATIDQLNTVKNELTDLKKASLVNTDHFVNTKRGGYLLNVCDSGPTGLVTNLTNESSMGDEHKVSAEIKTTLNNSRSLSPVLRTNKSISSARGSPKHIEACCANTVVSARDETKVIDDHRPALAHISSTERATEQSTSDVNNVDTRRRFISSPGVTTNKLTFSEVVQQKGEWKQESPSDAWILIQRTRLKNRFLVKKGTARSRDDAKFKAADIKIPLFINYVDKSASDIDISNYILSKTQTLVKLEKINMKRDRDYDAYKVFVPKQKLPMFLDDHLWPEGICFRRFVNLRDRNKYNSKST